MKAETWAELTADYIGKKTDWTKERNAQLTRLWLAGQTLDEIAHAMRVSRNTVWGRTKRLGLPSRRKREWTAAEVAELTQRWQEGQSASTIAKAMDRGDKNAILGKLYRLGLLKDPVRLRPLRAAKVVTGGSGCSTSQPERHAFAREARWEQPIRPVTLPRLKWLDNYSIA